MAIRLAYEKFLNIPIPPDGVSFGKINADGITTFLSTGNTLLSGSYSYDSVTITLQGILNPPLTHPGRNVGSVTFSFRNRTWTLLDVQEGNIIIIANTPKYLTWSCTGVDLRNPSVSIG
jgi:hypothetical protein